MGKQVWVTSTNEEIFSCDEEYTSREEAVKNAPEDLYLYDGDGFYVGVQKDFKLTPCDNFLDVLIEKNNEELGDYSESWINRLFRNEKVKEFVSEKMEEICDFIHKECPPDFFVVKNIEAVCVESSEERS